MPILQSLFFLQPKVMLLNVFLYPTNTLKTKDNSIYYNVDQGKQQTFSFKKHQMFDIQALKNDFYNKSIIKIVADRLIIIT